MDTIQVGIKALSKSSKTEPWKMTFLTPADNVEMTMSLDKVEVGPRLREVLSTIEGYTVAYPRLITGKELENLNMTTRDSFIVKLLANVPAYVEIGFRTFRQFRRPVAPKVKGEHAEYIYKPTITSTDVFTMSANNGGPPTTKNFTTTVKKSDYLLTGELVLKSDGTIDDGDTFKFKINGTGVMAATDRRLRAGETIKVRVTGYNAPETEDHGTSEGNERNKEYIKEYLQHIDEDKRLKTAFKIGAEAKEALQDFISGDGELVLEVDSNFDGSPKTDPYQRFVCAVYKTSFTSGEEVFTAGEFETTNVSKQMMGTMSTIEPKAPLTIPYYYFIDQEYSRLNVTDWLYELGIRKYAEVKVGDQIDDYENKTEPNAGTPLAGGEMVGVKYGDSVEFTYGQMVDIKYEPSGSNQIDFMEPYDDRREEFFPDGVDHQCRIGDVMLTIPPIAIEVNRVGAIRKIKTLRSKSSMLIKGGSSATTITLQLYFHDIDSINGRKEKMHPDKDRYYYLDGLRPLIAQFKKAPFVPIDNKYINETLGIDSVALVNLSIQTVPGFPHSIAANLVLAKFDHSAYMPQLSRLGQGINYPMFRWYYQEPMNDKAMAKALEDSNNFRTWLQPIPESGLTNDFKFLIARQEHLEARKQALRDMRNMTNPLIAEERFFNPDTETVGSGGDGSDPNTLRGMEYKDGLAAQRVLDQYNRYLKLINSHKFEPQKGDRAVGLPNATKKEKELFNLIYGEGKTEDEVRTISHFAPFESHIYDMDRMEMGPGSFSDEDSITWSNEKNGGILIRLYAQKNIDLFKEKADAGKKGNLISLYVPGYEIDAIVKIVNRGKAAETAYLKDIEEWNNAKAIIQQTEAKIPLDPAPMKGELIPTAVSVIYENQFSNIQLQALESPSFQFLGGQDPYIQVTFEADDLAVQSVREMLETTEMYSREFRTGITSGFLGVENHLMGLFGVETVMPETVQIRTVQGFPGRYQIEMTLCGFNKTQKRMEQLEGISPIYGDEVPDREARSTANVEEAADAAIIEFKMRQMELYPDLELPKYDELVAALPYMNANCTVYENRTGGVYVDPDFYMATPNTLRQIVRDAIDDPNGHSLQLKDFMGVEMVTNSLATNPLDGEAGMWDILNSVDQRTSRIDSNFSWSGNAGNKNAGNSNSEGITYKDKAIEEYVKDRNKIKEPPTKEEWDKWGLDLHYRNYNTWLENPQPTEAQVYNKIYELVDKHWTNSSETPIYNDKNVNTKSTAWQKVTYASAPDLWDAEWNKLASDNPEFLKDGQKKDHKTSISSRDYKAGSKSKVPRERIANIIKAVIHARSKWKQMFASGMPYIDGQGNAAGIMGIPISSEAKDVATAKRLLWDWEYNIEKGVKQLYEAYKEALAEKNLEYKCRPWEWMVSAYATGTIKGDLRNGFWQQVNGLLMSHYNGYDRLYATPTSQMNMTILQQRNGYDSHQMGVIQGNKDALIKELLDMGYRRIKDDNLFEFNDEYYTKAETKKWLEGKTADGVRKIYEKYSKDQLDTSEPYEGITGTDASIAAATAESYENQGNREELADAAETYDAYKSTGEFIDNAMNNRLVSNDMPQDVFPDMFTDMIEYDHRMRLVRAFPTFQMFIVDEGKWMTNYRLWDNLYGFNAIQSIDIHKSRKIAADTAVIKMTNIYSNLTSRSLDTTYEEWDYKFWDNLVFGNPNEKILEARKELLSSLLLQTGARIHLRLGYGSSATDLPVVFNGTITEMNADEMVEIVAQGDGIELGNVISGDPGDDNKSLLKGVTEPRDLICELMTSKGNWFKDIVNYASEGALFKDNPLGIQHFGQPAGKEAPPGNLKWFNDNYGEAAQNIYSSNGVPTFSQWSMPDGSDIPFSFTGTPMLKWAQPGDEQNVVVPFYNNTPWDIFQTLAYCSPDYICAVHPFEMRSTLFFGKPYWKMAYKYDSRYEYDKNQKAWVRYRDLEHRKPYSQFHVFSSETDIIGNGIKASEEGVYTNVIVNYDGKQVGPIYADFDIRFDKQKTTIVDAQIVSRTNGLDFWTSEKQAMYYGMSAVRDYMKDMYKGELIVLGDPTIKPHDICYMNDTMYDMNGNFMVKAVTHSFSHETGFISCVQPDALVINDDLSLLSVSNWGLSMLVKVASTLAGYAFGAKVIKKLIPSSVMEGAMKYGTAGAARATEHSLSILAKQLPDDMPEVSRFKTSLEKLKGLPLDDPDRELFIRDIQDQARKIQAKVANMDFTNQAGAKVKGLKSKWMSKRTSGIVKSAADALTDGAGAFKSIRGAGLLLFGLNPVSAIAAIATTWATETINEKYRRKKAMLQCVLMMPLQYQGRQYTAGINGHRGMVVGDSMGRIDSFLSGMGFDGKNHNGEGVAGALMDAWNWLTDAEGKDYAITEDELRSGALEDPEGDGGGIPGYISE